jgi:hypothetical protein
MAEDGSETCLVGVARQSKAGPLLRKADGSSTSCLGKWPEGVLGKRVEVRGAFVEVSAAQAPFPIATCDEDGNWSQGIRGVAEVGFTSMDPLGVLHTAKPAEVTLTYFKIHSVTLSRD